ncbi:DUF2069 domain-containing protein [Porticoccus litoralis]|jgi:uncharacterized membrane protein|uniref:DUF2069 domain-containing protein n=1 Tax=Porticoccus litoralis TaxID=434086 RepID=A0AAW8B1J5_9GAMM|nr:DUF2069 domain-containing protein [Porticoccus litoralis]MDP1519940.1 DUF2069 domain-containing protein [Porticoccus litoralis]
MTKVISQLSKKLGVARKLTWGSYLLLMAVLLANAIWSGTPVSLMVFTMVPLLIFLPGLRRERYKTISMLCFVTLMYFMVTVTNLFAPSANWLDAVELVLIVVLFGAAMMFSRWKQYSLYQEDNP